MVEGAAGGCGDVKLRLRTDGRSGRDFLRDQHKANGRANLAPILIEIPFSMAAHPPNLPHSLVARPALVFLSGSTRPAAIAQLYANWTALLICDTLALFNSRV